MHGHGIFNWWGFSPPVDFFSYINDKRNDDETVQMVMIGAGDPRHLLLTLARWEFYGKRFRVYVVEAQVEVYARLLLLMGAALQLGLGLRERAALILDLWANLCLRPASRTYLEHFGRRLSITVTDPGHYSKLVGLVNAEKLKYRERDALDAVCRSWYTITSVQYDPSQAWDTRLRKLLGTRYDYKHAEADWAWHMRLAFRIQKLFLDSSEQDELGVKKVSGQKDGYVGVSDGWGQEFMTWRKTGCAFTVATDCPSTIANTSLVSVAEVRDGGSKHEQFGYWGDVLIGPFPALALASHTLHIKNAQHGCTKYSGSELALRQLEFLLKELWTNCLQDEEEDQEETNLKSKSENKDHVKETIDQKLHISSKQTWEEKKDLTNPPKDEKQKVAGVEKKSTLEEAEDAGAQKQYLDVITHLKNENENKEEEIQDNQEGKSLFSQREKEQSQKADQPQDIEKENNEGEILDMEELAESLSNIRKEDNTKMMVVRDNKDGTEQGNKKDDERVTHPTIAADDEIVHDLSEEQKSYIEMKSQSTRSRKNATANIHNTTKQGEIEDTDNKTSRDLQTDKKHSRDRKESTGLGLDKEGNESGLSRRTSVTDSPHRVRKKSSVEGGRPYFDYLEPDGVEVVLLSPSRLSDLSSLPEMEGGVDLVYVSAATAHLISPTLLSSHLTPDSTLILETVQMFPELTDDQVVDYEARVTTAAEEAGWVRGGPDPLCHLTFRR